MRVADITSGQLPELARLFEELSGLATDVPRMTAVFGKMAGNPGYHLLGACQGSVLVGALLGIECLDCVGDCRSFMVVENVIVAEAYRRRGVGRLLLEEIEGRAREHDCFYVMLVSGPGREAAHAFYTARGYDVAAGFKKRL
jgi:GNAT superfamily N-acetyltransferase